LVAVAAGSRCDALQVRARSGFAHRNGANQLSARHAGEPRAFLRVAAVREDVVRSIVMNEGMKGHAFARELLHDDRLMGEASSPTAELHGHVAEQHPHGTSLRPCVRVREPLLAPTILMGREFGLYERADSRAERPQRVTRAG